MMVMDQKSENHFHCTPMVPRIPKRYHKYGYNYKMPIKTLKILQNPSVLDILDIPDHPDGDQKSENYFQSTPMVPRIPKRYHMYGYNDKMPIKTPKILQNPSFWTFLTFLIILMVTKYPRNYFYVLLWSQGFQKGIICGVTMSKPPSRHP